MKVSCIIVNHNLTYLLRLCIEALERSQCNFPFEIIVVDNNSKDENLLYLRKKAQEGKITLISAGSNLGYGKANNLGANHSRGEYLLILNPDVYIEPDALKKMVDFFEKHPGMGILGPQLYFFNGQIQDSCRRFMRPLDLVIKRTPLQRLKALKKRVDEYVMAEYDHQVPREVDLVTGACFLIPKKVFEKVGGFDERYFLFMEDADICRKVWEAGFKVMYFPLARALHYHKRLSAGNMLQLLGKRLFWTHIVSAAKYFWKWRGKPLPHV